MNLVRQIWPTPFRVKKGDILSLVIQIVIFLVVCAVVGWLIGLLASIPVIGWIFGIVGSLMGIYSLVGVILCVLKFLGKV